MTTVERGRRLTYVLVRLLNQAKKYAASSANDIPGGGINDYNAAGLSDAAIEWANAVEAAARGGKKR